jgi:transposase
MLTLPPSVRVYVAAAPIDMRKSFDGLSIAVGGVLDLDPTSGHLFCFFNRRATQVRVLFWDRTGYCIYAKRLARGRFSLAALVVGDAKVVQVEAAELSLVLEGIDLAGATRRARFRLPPAA